LTPLNAVADDSESAAEPKASDEKDVTLYERPGVEVPDDIESKDALFKALGASGVLMLILGVWNQDFVSEHESLCMIAVFLLGYAGIIFEETVAWNKSGIAMIMAVLLWTIYALGAPDTTLVTGELSEHLSDVSEIVFFLIGAMTIVETVDSHRGFKVVTDVINTRDSLTLLGIIGGITFFMSAALDNLTTTIVMISLLRKFIPNDPKKRMFFGGAVVIAANAGGAWSPIGDVTTTMLWINGQITALNTVSDLILPSAVSMIVSFGAMALFVEEAKGDTGGQSEEADLDFAPGGKLMFYSGVSSLLFVPIFKSATHLPPYLGMLCSLGYMWLLTDSLHYGKPGRDKLRVPHNLTRIDTTGVMFFLGILLSIASLESVGVLKNVAVWLSDTVPSTELVAGAIGVASAIIDNVPLVAATMGMYDLSEWPADSELWQLIAYCAGTGGSILIIGSAAGVAFMGMEKAEFGWYVKKITPWAFLGYVAGIGAYVGQGAVTSFFATIPAAVDVVPQIQSAVHMLPGQ